MPGVRRESGEGRDRAGQVHGEQLRRECRRSRNSCRWMPERRRNAWRGWPARAASMWRGNRRIIAGLESCRAAALVSGGGKGCSWGCLGLAIASGSAISTPSIWSRHGLPVVTEVKCTACGDCVEVCPKSLFSLHAGESPAVGGVPESAQRRSGGSRMRSGLHGLRALRGGCAGGSDPYRESISRWSIIRETARPREPRSSVVPRARSSGSTKRPGR